MDRGGNVQFLCKLGPLASCKDGMKEHLKNEHEQMRNYSSHNSIEKAVEEEEGQTF